MRSVVLLCVFIALSASQSIGTDTLPISDPKCKTSAFTVTDRTSSYVAGFTGVTKICARPYVDVCTGPSGLTPCNNHYGQCSEVGYDWTDKVMYPNVKTTIKPTVCVSAGFFMTPDVKVLVIAQVIFGFFFFAIAIALALKVGRAVPGASLYVVIAQVVMSLTLMFSFYYLNGVVQLAASIAALALYRTRNATLTAVGILFCLSAFFWVTYRFGLGNMQHQSRFGAGMGDADTYENYCINYYRGYFGFNAETQDVGNNPADGAWGYCARNWVAAVLFFQILAELLLVLLAATGIQALLFEEPAKTISETEPAQ